MVGTFLDLGATRVSQEDIDRGMAGGGGSGTRAGTAVGSSATGTGARARWPSAGTARPGRFTNDERGWGETSISRVLVARQANRFVLPSA